MEAIEKKENKLIFKTQVSETLLNSIRRFVNRIPTLAIEEVEISKNDGALTDESLAHRLGLLVLKTDKVFGGKTTKKLDLKTKKEGIVFAEEIKGDAKIVYPQTPILILDKGQDLELKAIAKMGVGRTHAKHVPGLVFYRNIAEITLDKEFESEIKKAYPDAIIKDKSGKIVVSDDGKKEIADFAAGLAESVGKPTEVNYKEELICEVESFGQLSTTDIIKSSIAALKTELASVSKQLK